MFCFIGLPENGLLLQSKTYKLKLKYKVRSFLRQNTKPRNDPESFQVMGQAASCMSLWDHSRFHSAQKTWLQGFLQGEVDSTSG